MKLSWILLSDTSLAFCSLNCCTRAATLQWRRCFPTRLLALFGFPAYCNTLEDNAIPQLSHYDTWAPCWTNVGCSTNALSKVRWCRAVDGAVHQDAQTVFDSLCNPQPLKMTERCAQLNSSLKNESGGGVEDRLHCLQCESKKSSPLKLFAIFSLRSSIFTWNFASICSVHIYTHLPMLVDLS